MNFTRKMQALLAVTAICVLPTVAAHAAGPTLNSNTAVVNLSASLLSSLTVSTGSPTVSFSLVNGTTTNGATTAPITTSWVLLSTNATVKLYGYFSSATSALSDAASDAIPASAVLGSVTSTGGAASAPTTTLTAFSQTGPTGFGVAGSALLLDTYTLSATNFVNLTGVTDTLGLAIATPATLPAGTYSGVLTIEAQAN
jgi:hypothetical protein